MQTIHKTHSLRPRNFCSGLENCRGVTSWRGGHLANHLGEVLCGDTLKLHETLLGPLL